MQTCDVAVVGLGLMGSAALDALLAAGIDALGSIRSAREPCKARPTVRCRVFPRFNFENDNYTNLSDEAFEGWIISSSIATTFEARCKVCRLGSAVTDDDIAIGSVA